MSSQKSSRKLTQFDITCEEHREYAEKYKKKLSYGYYSLYKEIGLLKPEWYEYLIGAEDSIPKDFNLVALEYPEFKSKYHGKTNFTQYCEKRKHDSLPKKWQNYIKETKQYIPEDLNFAYQEYIEYCQMFHESLYFFEYYSKKESGKLNLEWYKLLLLVEDDYEQLSNTEYL